MDVNLDCIPCFQTQALNAVRFANGDEALQEKVMRTVIKTLLELKWDSSSTEMANKIHSLVRNEIHEYDPYKKIKKESNDAVLKLYPDFKHLVKNSQEPIKTSVLLSIAGNIIDLAANSQFDLEKTIMRVMDEGLTLNDLENFTNKLKKAKSLLYLADNTGEIVLDKLLLETILEKYDLEKIIFAVKGAPIINDAMKEDALYVGLEKIQGIEFIDIGVGTPGTGIEKTGKKFRDMLESVDMVISKGQGNYEALSDMRGIFFMLMAKCRIVGEHLGVPQGSFVLMESGL